MKKPSREEFLAMLNDKDVCRPLTCWVHPQIREQARAADAEYVAEKAREHAIENVRVSILDHLKESVTVSNETVYTQSQVNEIVKSVAVLAQSAQAQPALHEQATAADDSAGKVQADIVRYLVGNAGEPERTEALAYEPYGDYLSVTQVGVLTSLGADFIREAIKEKELPASNIGTAEKPLYRVARKDVDEFMAKRRLEKKKARKERSSGAASAEEQEAATLKTQADVLAYFGMIEGPEACN